MPILFILHIHVSICAQLQPSIFFEAFKLSSSGGFGLSAQAGTHRQAKRTLPFLRATMPFVLFVFFAVKNLR